MKKQYQKRIIPIILALLLTFTGSIYAATNETKELTPTSSNSQKYKSDEVLVVFKDDTTKSEAKEVLKENDTCAATTIKTDGENITVASIEDNTNPEKKSEEIENDPNVEIAQPNYMYKLLSTLDDPKIVNMWHLNSIFNINNSSGISAWDYSTGENIGIAIIDSGTNPNNPDLSDNIKEQYNCVLPINGSNNAGYALYRGFTVGSYNIEQTQVNSNYKKLSSPINIVSKEDCYLYYENKKVNTIKIVTNNTSDETEATIEPSYNKTLAQQYNSNTLKIYTIDQNGKILSGSAFDLTLDNSNIQDDYSFEGHGTHVAGIAAAKGNNKKLGAGVAYNSDLYIANVFSNYYNPRYDEYGSTAYTYDIIRAYDWAESKGARVINLSLGSYGYDYSENHGDYIFEKKINDAYNKEQNSILTVCAAGNYGDEDSYIDEYGNSFYSFPSDFPNSYSVVALSRYGDNVTRAYYSDHNKYKDIAAPGTTISSLDYQDDEALMGMSGTSMASPYVAGVAALLFSEDPSLKASEVANILNTTATDRGAKGKDNYYGYGVINPCKALAKVINSKSTFSMSIDNNTDRTYNRDTGIIFSMNLSKTLPVKVYVTNSSGTIIKTLSTSDFTAINGTEYNFTWKYDDDNNTPVIGDTYYIKCALSNENGTDTKNSIYSYTLKLNDVVSDVTSTKSSVYRASGYSTGVKYTLNDDAYTTIKVKNSSGTVVRTLMSNSLKSKGTYSVSWNLKDSKGRIVAPGKYKFEVYCKNNKEESTHASYTTLVKATPKVSAKRTKSTYNVSKKSYPKVKVTTNQISKVTVKVYNSKGKNVRSLVYKKTYSNGSRYFKWSGKTKSGKKCKAGKYYFKVYSQNENGTGKVNSAKFNLKR